MHYTQYDESNIAYGDLFALKPVWCVDQFDAWTSMMYGTIWCITNMMCVDCFALKAFWCLTQYDAWLIWYMTQYDVRWPFSTYAYFMCDHYDIWWPFVLKSISYVTHYDAWPNMMHGDLFAHKHWHMGPNHLSTLFVILSSLPELETPPFLPIASVPTTNQTPS